MREQRFAFEASKIRDTFDVAQHTCLMLTDWHCISRSTESAAPVAFRAFQAQITPRLQPQLSRFVLFGRALHESTWWRNAWCCRRLSRIRPPTHPARGG
jgi:hypothetical protein